MTKPLAVVIGAAGKLPLAGLSFYYLQHVFGLQTLGYDVHYLERQNQVNDCYDPRLGAMTDDPSYALDYLGAVLPQFGIQPSRYRFIDRDNRCHGAGWPALCEVLDRCDFVLTVANPTWFDELERCPRRAFIDGDPAFTQVAMETGEGSRAFVAQHYDTLFTYGTRLGKVDCTIPVAGRHWIPARPVVATSLWKVTPPTADAPITVLCHWSAGKDVSYGGRIFGHKNREFEKFMDLPRHSSRRFVLAVDGKAPKDRLRECGWQLTSPLNATITIKSFQGFIDRSLADLGIAKHAYVSSRSGWFSDRSTCYLAAGRPVLHQDTGCGDWLPTGEGVLLFSDMNDLQEALRDLELDYSRHARKARGIAEEYFEAAKVLGNMLDAAGLR